MRSCFAEVSFDASIQHIHISPNLKCGSYHFPHCSAYNCTLIVSQECCFVYYLCCHGHSPLWAMLLITIYTVIIQFLFPNLLIQLMCLVQDILATSFIMDFWFIQTDTLVYNVVSKQRTPLLLGTVSLSPSKVFPLFSGVLFTGC